MKEAQEKNYATDDDDDDGTFDWWLADVMMWNEIIFPHFLSVSSIRIHQAI